MSNIYVNKPESQSVVKCATLRQSCRDSIFERIDYYHEDQMNVIGKIQTDIAFMRGKAEGERPKRNGKIKNNIIHFFISWGPGIIFLIILGIITWLKSKKYL